MEEENNRYVSVKRIYGFEELFAQQTLSKDRHLRFGSKLLISGPPGAGKTTFALATVRAMMAEARSESTGIPTERRIVYYISSEVHEDQLIEGFGGYGWFAKKEDSPGRDNDKGPFLFRMGSSAPDATNFYAITPMPEVDRPVPSAEELVNGIFSRISKTLQPSESPTEPAKVYVIVDSISALLKGCLTPGDERRQTHEIMRRLQDKFDEDHLALIILLAEQGHHSHDSGAASAKVSPTEPSVEDYLADVVFRLYVRSMPLGRRIRVLEVVKSQGANMILGEHTWQIASTTNHDTLRDKKFKSHVCSLADGEIDSEPPNPKEPKLTGRWGTIIIFPRPRLGHEPHVDSSSAPEKTDIEVLEQVKKGSVTLIAGPMGCNKTTLCKRFLNANVSKEERRDLTKLDELRRRRFLISFDSSNTQQEDTDCFTKLSFTQSQFDLNVLASHITFVLTHNGCDRIAFDGLSEWITMFDKPEAARMLEALMITVRQKLGEGSVPPTVFMTYELPLGDDPLGPSALGTTADNILVVRPVAINDIIRRIIYILKHESIIPKDARQDPAQKRDFQHPVELEWRGSDPAQLHANFHSLDAYTGLLRKDGEVKQAQVLVQFFAENGFEEKFNAERGERLRNQFMKRIDLTTTTFNLSEIGTTLDTALGSANPSEAFNLSVHSVDEWWLGSHKIHEFLIDLSKQDDKRQEHVSKGRSPENLLHDFWWFEVEKAMPREEGKPVGIFAVPAYMDFGMLCYYPDDLQQLDIDLKKRAPTSSTPKAKPQHSESARDRWVKELNGIPRLWAALEGANEWESVDGELVSKVWFKADAEGEPDTANNLVDFALRKMEQRRKLEKGTSYSGPVENLRRRPIFTFDSSTRETCACMFLEWAWAFGGSESLLGEEQLPSNQKAIKLALYFAQFMIMEGLMPARGTEESGHQDGSATLFSRQWYSTLRGQQEEGKWNIIGLPFMPVGLSDEQSLWRALLDDIAVRQHFWCQRAREYALACQLSVGLSDLEDITKRLLLACEEKAKPFDVKTVLNLALEAYTKTRRWLLWAASTEMVANDDTEATRRTLNATLDDLMELGAWAAFRLQLMLGGKDGKFPLGIGSKSGEHAAKAVYHARWVRHYLPELDQRISQMPRPVATGWVCTGSWMYGVGKKSRSSAVQNQILGELTSLETAQKRANEGAGLPTRKDFYSLNGEESVEGMPYLNWRELLRYGGSRARRRDRVLANRPKPVGDLSRPLDPMPLYEVIYQEMLASMRIADLWREDYASGGEKRNNAMTVVKERANLAYTTICEKARSIRNKTSPQNSTDYCI